jgi:EAL domain-containing protein (putative c-di-GMP-specific phosphodiesterase class I)
MIGMHGPSPISDTTGREPATLLPPPADAGADALAGARLILERRLFFAEYEPVVSLHSGQVVAHEALARFLRPDGQAVSPATMFSLLHAEPALLLQAEVLLKRHQLDHAPRDGDLFVNLDPDSWAAGNAGPGPNPLLDLLGRTSARVVVEVTEALDESDSALARELVGVLRARGQRYALDDVGAQNSLLSFEALDDADVLKFDRILLRRLGHPRRHAIVRALAEAARATGARTVLEGIETVEDLQLARDLGVDLVQGWYFSRLCRHSPRPSLEPTQAPSGRSGRPARASARSSR